MVKPFVYRGGDFQAVIRSNKRKTWFVIATFLLIYVGVGLLIDLYLNYNLAGQVFASQHSPMADSLPSVGALLLSLFQALISFHIVPRATLFILCVAVVWIACTFLFYERIMLAGLQTREVNGEDGDVSEKRLYNLLEEMKVAANLKYMPRLYLIDAPYLNAFASGYSEKTAFIAVTKPLVALLNREEMQAVIAHELTHIRNQDIRLNLFVATLSNLITFFVTMAAFFLPFFSTSNSSSRGNSDQDRGAGGVFQLVFIILYFVLPLLTAVLTLFLSRTREYMADAGSVELTRNPQALASALVKLQTAYKRSPRPSGAPRRPARRNEFMREASYIVSPRVIYIKTQDSEAQEPVQDEAQNNTQSTFHAVPSSSPLSGAQSPSYNNGSEQDGGQDKNDEWLREWRTGRVAVRTQGGRKSSLGLFSTHPSLEKRLVALGIDMNTVDS